MGHPYDALTLAELSTRRSMKWNAFGSDVLPAWVAEMDFPHAEPITRSLTAMVRASDTGYPWHGGLAEAYAAFSLRRYGFEPDISGAGMVPDILRGIAVALERLTPSGSSVAFLTPAYPPFFETVQAVGRGVTEVPMVRAGTGRYELDPERIDSAMTEPNVEAFLLCNPHNPVGRVFDRTELEMIARSARRHGVLMLVDEVHAPLTYPADGSADSGHVPFASLGELARPSVTFVSASKGWNLPGLKCALAIGDGPEPASVFADLSIEIRAGASPLGVAANIAAFDEGEAWLDDTVRYLDGNRALLAELLAEQLPEVGYAQPEATYLGWLDCRALGIGDDPAGAFLRHGRVALNPGDDYGDDGKGFVRLNFGTSRAILTEVVSRMAGAVRDIRAIAE